MCIQFFILVAKSAILIVSYCSLAPKLSSTIATLPAVKVGIAPSAIGLSTVYCDNLDPRGAVRVNVMNNRKPSETVEDYTCLSIIPQGYM